MGSAAALELLIALLNNASTISALLKNANDEGRDIAPQEWATIKGADDAARKLLVDAIKAAGG